jgi:serralysin
MSVNTKKPEDGLEGDFPIAPEFDFSVDPFDVSVDDRAGDYIRNKLVLTPDQVAFYLNRGDRTDPGAPFQPLDPNDVGAQYVPRTGASWEGHKGNVNGIFDAPVAGKTPGTPLDTLTFGFFETKADVDPAHFWIAGNAPGVSRADGFSTFDAAQRDAARQAMATWDEILAVQFKETSSAQADINFMNTTTGPIQASAFLPYDYGADFARVAGDVAVNPNQVSNHQFDEGQYGLTTLIHELGHSLGLEHPGNYNFGPGFSATYVNGAEYYQDSNQYSIMSYWGGRETGAANVNWNNLTFVYASTPGVHDILAAQRIYGADTTTRSGNDTYGFNTSLSTAGRNDDSYDFVKTPLPIITIWDTGGIDTLDLSGNSTIDLNPGQFSSAGGSGVVPLAELKARGVLPASYTQAQYDALRAAYNSPDGLLHDNISIAYGVTIENAVGGAGNDTITGNAVANVLDGGAGNDVLMGGAGKDTLKGGAGFDNASWANATAGVKVSVGNNFSGDSGEGDKFTSIEKIEGSNFGDELKGGNSADTLFGLGGNDQISGGNSADTLDGGAGNDFIEGGNDNDSLSGGDGVDTLDGGNGNDLLDGGAGNDSLKGGNGADTYVFDANSGTDTIQGLSRDDRIDLSAFGTDDQVSVDTSRAGKIFVDAGNDGDVDLTILYTGSRPTGGMFEYADAGAAGGASSAMQTEYLIAA